ncbi:MAG: hypothetical protein WCA56_01090 [Xanthobacteraceae bacterium]
MTLRRKILYSLMAAFAIMIGAIVILPGASNFVLLFLDASHDSLWPDTISWDAKNAWLKCPGAIADPRKWPSAPPDACNVEYMCLNEGALSKGQIEALDDQIRNTPGCQKP